MLNHKSLLFLRVSCFFFLLVTYKGIADPTQKTGTVNINVSGVVVTKPNCTINDSETIEVMFGSSIGINTIDGINNRKEIPYSITCDGNTDSLQLVLKITGMAVDFDSDNATITTSEKNDLGIKIFQDNKPFTLNANININADHIPTLEAVLIKRENAILTEGEFNAVATMHAEYQ